MEESVTRWLTIALEAMQDIQQSKEKGTRLHRSIGDIKWVLSQLALFPGFTSEQQVQIARLVRLWDEVLYQ